MESLINLKYIVGAIVFSVLGIIILAISFIVFDRLTPGDLWKEVVEKQNVALAIIAASMILSISHIISSAIHG